MTEEKVLYEDKNFDFNIDEEKEQASDEDEMSIEEQFAELKIDKEILESKIATSGSPTPAIIKEARELAGSKKGLDIDAFFTKHRLVGVDIEQLLNAPLKKDGSYA